MNNSLLRLFSVLSARDGNVARGRLFATGNGKCCPTKCCKK